VGGVEVRRDVMGSGEHKRPRGYRGALSSYLGAIRRYKLLTQSGERRIATDSHQGDEEAKNQLVEGNLRLVVKLAKELRTSFVGLDDLIAEGNLGLIEAARRFDPGRGVRFVAYATWWIRKYMLQAINRHAHQTTAPKPGSGGERADGQKVPRQIIASLDDAAVELVGGGAGDDLEDTILGDDLAKALRTVLPKLPPKERQILTLHFGLDGSVAQTLQQIGAELGLTRERVRQLELRALERARRLLQGGRAR
jgi:RNA polymerase primary sigma factor